jgi:hypothetical protein
VRLTVRHRYDFGVDRELVGDDLVRPEAWDRLRTQTHGPFAMATTRDGLEAQADEREEIGERMRVVSAWLDANGVQSLASYGAGGGIAELWLLRHAPARRLVATDYGEVTIERLRTVLPELEVVRHDLLADGPLDADVHLFHRIDTEFSNRQFRAVLNRFASARLLIVATQITSVQGAIDEMRKAMRPNTSRAGWARTRGAFEALWTRTHTATPLRFNDLEGWGLEPRA